MKRDHIVVAAVLYDPKVVAIWDGIADFFAASGEPIECTFFSTYTLQVDALVAGVVDIAWNSPLAWVDVQRRTGSRGRALAMRDTDRDRVTHLVSRRDGPVASTGDLRGRVLATGAADSPQATLLPIHLLGRRGLRPAEHVTVQRHDVMVGKHGDHVGGELDALRAVQRGDADAAAILDLNWERWLGDGTADEATLRVIDSTAPFDHCNFTALDTLPAERTRRWTDVLLAMRYDDPVHRALMDLEGLTAWLPGRTSGYSALTEAVEQQGFFG